MARTRWGTILLTGLLAGGVAGLGADAGADGAGASTAASTAIGVGRAAAASIRRAGGDLPQAEIAVASPSHVANRESMSPP